MRSMAGSRRVAGVLGRLLILAGLTIGTIIGTSVAAGAQDVVIKATGGSDELIPPPSPPCEDVVFVTEALFDAAGNPINNPRLGSTPGLVQVHDVPFVLEPGVAVLDEVITYDGHIGRRDQVGDMAQTEEQVRFEFLLDGVVQASTPLTPDVPDGQRSAWIDVDLGSYVLPNGADTLRIVHSGSTASPNSVIVSALCGHHEDLPAEPGDGATEPTDDATEPTDDGTEPTDDAVEPPADDEPGAPADDEVDEPSVADADVVREPDEAAPADGAAAGDDEPSAEVLGDSAVPQLAVTGRSNTLLIVFAALCLIVSGVAFVLAERETELSA